MGGRVSNTSFGYAAALKSFINFSSMNNIRKVKVSVVFMDHAVDEGTQNGRSCGYLVADFH